MVVEVVAAEDLEVDLLPRGLARRAKCAHGVREERADPFLAEQCVVVGARRGGHRRSVPTLPSNLVLGGGEVDRDERDAATSLDAGRGLLLVGDEAVEADAEEGPEPRARRVEAP